MRQCNTPMLVVAAALAAPACALASGRDDTPNAALRYWSIWDLYHISDEAREALRGAVERVGETDWQPTPVLDNALGDEVWRSYDRATQLERCDFEVDTGQTPFAYLPHLSHMLRTGRLLAYDARLKLEDGDRAGAIARIAAAYRLAHHCAQDDIIVLSRVASDIFELADAVAIFTHTQRSLDENEKAELCDALERFPRHDPWRYRASTIAETETYAAWITRSGGSAQGIRELYQEIDSLASMDGVQIWSTSEIAFRFRIMNEGGFEAAGERFTEYARELELAWTPSVHPAKSLERDARLSRLSQLHMRVLLREFGTLGAIFTTNPSSVFRRAHSADRALNAALERVSPNAR